MSRGPTGHPRRLLVANRGEIAARVLRTARAMGLGTVAVYSDADRDAPHVAMADAAQRLGPPAPAASYLDVEQVLAAARRSGADAVHPGYGFLAENPELARRCRAEGLVFVGPDPETIALGGNKGAIKRRLEGIGVAGVPGFDAEGASDEMLVEAARRIGYPVMVKAAHGGGGRGMRLVSRPGDLPDALATARSEAAAAFGSDELILERALAAPRHVEVQIFGDARGNVVHLGARDCSVQRRFQKLVEEAPAAGLPGALSREICAAAVRVARALDYVGAGTVEFLLDAHAGFYLLEVNTRLQVEHGVTELVTGLDLVEWQLRVAAGESLPRRQDEIVIDGHAIEARLCAEDPAAGFLPATGRVVRWEIPSGPGLRVDHALEPGTCVSPHYDSMVAKVMAWGRSRDEARRRLHRALGATRLLGVTTNRDFLRQVIEHGDFRAGRATTALVDALVVERPCSPVPDERWAIAAVLLQRARGRPYGGGAGGWSSAGWHHATLRLVCGDERRVVEVSGHGARGYVARSEWGEVSLRLLAERDGIARVSIGDGEHTVHCFADDREVWLDHDGVLQSFREDLLVAGETGASPAPGRIVAPMHGRIVSVPVSVGDAVERGDTLAVLEAMKMEHPVVSPRDGTVSRVAVTAGQQVESGAELVEVDGGGADAG